MAAAAGGRLLAAEPGLDGPHPTQPAARGRPGMLRTSRPLSLRAGRPRPTTVLDLVGYPGAPEGGVESFLEPTTVHESFAHDLPESDRWLIAVSQRPIALAANIGTTEVAAWRSIP